jgi:hypothetical protein
MIAQIGDQLRALNGMTHVEVIAVEVSLFIETSSPFKLAAPSYPHNVPLSTIWFSPDLRTTGKEC